MNLSAENITAVVAGDLLSVADSTWATLEQEYVASSADTANLNDLYQMRARAMSGESAMEYVYEQCPYGRVENDVLTVTLDFYIWVSSLDLAYSLHSDKGFISEAAIVRLPRAFDVVIDSASTKELGFLFEGSLSPETPYFDADGGQISGQKLSHEGSTVTLLESASCVLRASGEAIGFKHSLVIQLSATPVTHTDPETGIVTELAGYALENLETAITVSWQDGSGEVQSKIYDIIIPDCIADLLSICPDTLPSLGIFNDAGEPRFLLYYSACNGDVLKAGWEEED